MKLPFTDCNFFLHVVIRHLPFNRPDNLHHYLMGIVIGAVVSSYAANKNFRLAQSMYRWSGSPDPPKKIIQMSVPKKVGQKKFTSWYLLVKS